MDQKWLGQLLDNLVGRELSRQEPKVSLAWPKTKHRKEMSYALLKFRLPCISG